MTPQRGEIWWVNLEPMQEVELRKMQPYLVLTANTLNRLRQTSSYGATLHGSAGPPVHYSAYDASGQDYCCHYRPDPYRGEISIAQQDRNGVPSQGTGNP
jgi:hypothetical protein